MEADDNRVLSCLGRVCQGGSGSKAAISFLTMNEWMLASTARLDGEVYLKDWRWRGPRRYDVTVISESVKSSGVVVGDHRKWWWCGSSWPFWEMFLNVFFHVLRQPGRAKPLFHTVPPYRHLWEEFQALGRWEPRWIKYLKGVRGSLFASTVWSLALTSTIQKT